jgi:hypothetical protein
MDLFINIYSNKTYDRSSLVMSSMATKEELRELDNQVDVICDPYIQHFLVLTETDSNTNLAYGVISNLLLVGHWQQHRWTHDS